MWLLYPLWLINSATYLIILTLKESFVLCPRGQNHLHGFAELPQALWCLWILVAIRPIFLLMPAGSNAQRQPTMADHINGTCHFCQQSWMAIAVAGDHLPDPHSSGIPC